MTFLAFGIGILSLNSLFSKYVIFHWTDPDSHLQEVISTTLEETLSQVWGTVISIAILSLSSVIFLIGSIVGSVAIQKLPILSDQPYLWLNLTIGMSGSVLMGLAIYSGYHQESMPLSSSENILLQCLGLALLALAGFGLLRLVLLDLHLATLPSSTVKYSNTHPHLPQHPTDHLANHLADQSIHQSNDQQLVENTHSSNESQTDYSVFVHMLWILLVMTVVICFSVKCFSRSVHVGEYIMETATPNPSFLLDSVDMENTFIKKQISFQIRLDLMGLVAVVITVYLLMALIFGTRLDRVVLERYQHNST